MTSAFTKPKIYSMEEVAKILGVSYMTLYRMVKGGRINVINVAKTGTKPTFGFRESDIQAYYDRLSNPSTGLKSQHQ